MSNEVVQTKDEVQLVLYDKCGRVKQTSGSKKPISKLERFLNILERILEDW